MLHFKGWTFATLENMFKSGNMSTIVIIVMLAMLSGTGTISNAQPGRPPRPPGSPPKTTPTRMDPSVRFTHLTTEDGLVQNRAEVILQDRRGFMWIGTWDGLSRFDGYHFTTYQHDPLNPNSLSGNQVMDIFEDRDGMLWIATQNSGVNRFDPHTETFSHYRHDPANPNSLGGDAIFSIFQDRTGNFWFGGAGFSGLTRFDPIRQIFTRYYSEPDSPDGLQRGGISEILEDADGHLWFATDHHLSRFDPDTGQFTHYSPSPDERWLTAIYQDSDGLLWVGGTSGLHALDPASEQFTPYGNNVRFTVKTLHQDAAGILWISTEYQGVYLLDPRTGDVTRHYASVENDPHSLSGNGITTVYGDAAGVLWIGTRENGLNLFDPRQTQFTHYRHDPANPHSLPENSIAAMSGNRDGHLWVATEKAVSHVEPVSKRITTYPVEQQGDPRSIVSALYEDRQGVLWVGTRGTLARFDEATGKFIQYGLREGESPIGPPTSINSFVEDQNGALWIGMTHGGLFRLDPQRATVQRYRSGRREIVNDPKTLASGGVSTIFGDRAGNIWIGYIQGILSRFSPDTETFTHYFPQSGNAQRITAGWMEAIYEDHDGLLWLASKRGLTRFDPHAETFRLYTKRDGLFNTYARSIREDRSGHLWLGTDHGLFRFDPRSETFQNYDREDGAGGNHFKNAVWQMADGRLYFGGSHGVTAFYPEQVADNPVSPPVILTELRVFNEPVAVGKDPLLPQPLWDTDRLTFRHDQSIFSFEFAALSYAAPHKNRYRYKLEGLEARWNEVDSARRFTTYTDLEAGEYTFRVQATNSSGVWSEQEAALNITVLPSWNG